MLVQIRIVVESFDREIENDRVENHHENHVIFIGLQHAFDQLQLARFLVRRRARAEFYAPFCVATAAAHRRVATGRFESGDAAFEAVCARAVEKAENLSGGEVTEVVTGDLRFSRYLPVFSIFLRFFLKFF